MTWWQWTRRTDDVHNTQKPLDEAGRYLMAELEAR
ncbi:MAG: hypothetical protein KatS3mg111_3450 [Pirellulaceae bacterium]|nr:MAG: hypothetical protein KatS3mg111_0777 [Pirellulaceae bacterium]GIX00118.1 MAG: hypothetical protein KatS3mg111_3450 [Pirellulaceae bacterium]